MDKYSEHKEVAASESDFQLGEGSPGAYLKRLICTVSGAGSAVSIKDNVTGGGGGGPGVQEITDLQFADASGGAEVFYNGVYILIYTPANTYYAWFNLDGGSPDPAPGPATGFEVPVTTGDSGSTIASSFQANCADVLTILGEASGVTSTDTVTLTNAAAGDVTDINDDGSGASAVVTITVTQQGVDAGGGGAVAIPILPASTPVGVHVVDIEARCEGDGWLVTTDSDVTVMAVGRFQLNP